MPGLEMDFSWCGMGPPRWREVKEVEEVQEVKDRNSLPVRLPRATAKTSEA